jgi:transcriptional regulator with XRE-family HTH domain
MRNRLKLLRKEVNIELRPLSNYVGISSSIISNLENGKRTFRQTHIDALTNFFNVTTDYLLGLSDTGYIVFSEFDKEPIILSESDYKRLYDFIEVSIEETNKNIETSNQVSSEKGDENVSNHVAVNRRFKSDINEFAERDVLYKKFQDLGKRLTSDELKKIIEFIKVFIFK